MQNVSVCVYGLELNLSMFLYKLFVDVNGIEVKYIGLKEFIENKTASGRSQDIADLKEIKNIKR